MLKFFIEQKINQNGGFMKKRVSFCTAAAFLILICSSPVQAQVDTLWTKTFGGTDNDGGVSVNQTFDGGYIIVGYTNSFGAGSSDVWLIRTNTIGDTLWKKTFGGVSIDGGMSVQQTMEGGFITVGGTESYGNGGSDIWLIKTDSFGDTLWTKTFGGSQDDYGYSVQQTTDGGYSVIGVTGSFGASSSDAWLIKTDASGDTLWTRTFGGSYNDYGTSFQQTTDGGYIITGFTGYYVGVPESGDLWLIKTDADGDTLWTKTYGGSSFDAGNAVQKTADGDYIIIGQTYSFGTGSSDAWLIKSDTLGNTIWTKMFGGGTDDYPMSVQQTAEGGYIIAGYTYSFGAGSADVWLIKTDSFGDTLWTKTFGGISNDHCNSVKQTSDGGYILSGGTTSFGFGAGYDDVWLIKTTPDISHIEPNSELVISDFSLHQNYPNPFNPNTKIEFRIASASGGGFVTLKVYDVLGNEVTTLVDEFKPAGNYEIEWNTGEFSSGVYFYQLKAGNFIETKKMLLIK